MGLVDDHPTEAVFTGTDQMRIRTAKQDILQHGRVGEHDVGWGLTHGFTGVNHVFVFRFIQPVEALFVRIGFIIDIFASRDLLDASAKLLRIIAHVGGFWLNLREVAVIHCVGEFHTRGLFHDVKQFL